MVREQKMVNRLSSRVGIVMVILVVLLGLATSVMAQDPGLSSSIEVVGQIEMVEGITRTLTCPVVKL